MTLNRRTFLAATSATVLSTGLIGPLGNARTAEDLMTPGPLGEKTLGDPNAPVVIIEYASMTCGYCARFHRDVYPELKANYIDTGKVYFIFREFPLDPLAAGAFMLARCAGETRYFTFINALYELQASWTRTNDPVTALFNIARQAGFTQEAFDSCLTNQRLLDGVNWVKDRAEANFNVRSTPTFFVNGTMYPGVQTIEDFINNSGGLL
jgi:protein-disulfide isomerase